MQKLRLERKEIQIMGYCVIDIDFHLSMSTFNDTVKNVLTEILKIHVNEKPT